MRRMIGSLLLTLVAYLPALATPPDALIFCHEDQTSYPWELKDGSGLNIILLEMLARRLEITIELPAVPWKRCLQGLADNIYHGAFAASFKPERAAFAHYPRRADGSLDASRRLHTSGYTLYKLKASKLNWDGQRFTHLGPDDTIGYQTAFSIGDTLKALGVANLDDGSKIAERILEKLLLNRLAGVALQSFNGDQLLRSIPEFQHRIVAIDTPLITKPYFLILSKQMVAAHPQLARAIWTFIKEIRESQAYQKQADAFLARHRHR